MKLQIYEEKPKDEKPPVIIRLFNDDNGIEISAVDKEGNRVNNESLFTLGKWGIYRCGDVNPDLGFPLDEEGRIKLEGE